MGAIRRAFLRGCDTVSNEKRPHEWGRGRHECLRHKSSAQVGDAPRDLVPEGLGLELRIAFQGRAQLGPARGIGQGHFRESQRIGHLTRRHNHASRAALCPGRQAMVLPHAGCQTVREAPYRRDYGARLAMRHAEEIALRLVGLLNVQELLGERHGVCLPTGKEQTQAPQVVGQAESV